LVSEGILEGIKFALLNPKEAVERHLKEHAELAIGKNARQYVDLGVGMGNVIVLAPEAMEHGIGYTDLAKIDEQAKLVKQYLGSPGARDPPAAATFCSNNHVGKYTLTTAQWEEIRANTTYYAKLLGKA